MGIGASRIARDQIRRSLEWGDWQPPLGRGRGSSTGTSNRFPHKARLHPFYRGISMLISHLSRDLRFFIRGRRCTPVGTMCDIRGLQSSVLLADIARLPVSPLPSFYTRGKVDPCRCVVRVRVKNSFPPAALFPNRIRLYRNALPV